MVLERDTHTKANYVKNKSINSFLDVCSTMTQFGGIHCFDLMCAHRRLLAAALPVTHYHVWAQCCYNKNDNEAGPVPPPPPQCPHGPRHLLGSQWAQSSSDAMCDVTEVQSAQQCGS